MFRSICKNWSPAPALPVAFLALTLAAAAQPASAQLAAPAAQVQNLGPENQNQSMDVTIWLKLHNKPALDAAVLPLYSQNSAAYRHWLSDSQLATYLPTRADVEALEAQLAKQNLHVVYEDEDHLYVRARGTASDVASAFGTTIQRYSVNGRTVSAATSQPRLAGPAAALVSHVGGLDGAFLNPYAVRALNPQTRRPAAAIPLAQAQAISLSRNCFRGSTSQVFRTSGAKLPVGTYYGNLYGAESTAAQSVPAPCGYNAAEIAAAYGVDQAHQKGLNGKGQTIVIIVAYGSPTIWSDMEAYARMNGLPAFTNANFRIYAPGGLASEPNPDWALETTLDVELAHAIAPEAKIALVEAPTNSNSDLQMMLAYALTHHLGSVVSGSFGGPESADNSTDMDLWDALDELGAATGVSVNYASGDSGDFLMSVGQQTVSTPANSPYATSVGGTALALKANHQYDFETGWGNNYTLVAYDGALDPPMNDGFVYGAGGGESAFFAKPWFQSSLSGSKRQQPDVSALADPFTGASIVLTSYGQQGVEVVGGTSLACPVFSAIWAIAAQNAGQWLGQAAPAIARMPSSALHDVKPFQSSTNAAGMVFDSSGSTYYNASQLAAPVQNAGPFYSALWNAGPGLWYVLSFGTDSSLATAPGWDNVTGFGSPNGLAFIDAARR